MNWQTKASATEANSTPELQGEPAPARTPPVPAQKFPQQIAWTLATRLLMAVNSLGAGVIVARWLGAGGLGTLAVINVTVAMVVQLGSAGLPSANTYFIARDNRQLPAVACNSLIFGLLAGSLLALITTILAIWQPKIFSSISPRLITIAAASIPFQLIILLGINVFLALGR